MKRPDPSTLFDLQPGQKGVIRHVTAAPGLKIRFAEMGLLPGAQIEAHRVAPLGDPRAYVVRGYILSLRNREALSIELEPAA